MNEEGAVTAPRRSPRTIAVAAPEAAAVMPADVVKIELAEVVFGLTRKAIEGLIYRGDWLAGREYHRDPKGGIWVDIKGVQRWVVGGRGSR